MKVANGFQFFIWILSCVSIFADGDQSPGGDAPSPPVEPAPPQNPGPVPEEPPSPSVPDGVFLDRACRSITKDAVSTFLNPSYPLKEKSPLICQHVVVPKESYCALRIDFIDAVFTPRGEGCSADTVNVINSLDTPAVPQCGLLAGYQFTVRVAPGREVTLLITSQSETRWNLTLTQIPCSNIEEAKNLLPKDCGKGGEPAIQLRDDPEQIKLTQPIELLKRDNGSFLPFPATLRPEQLLRSAVSGFNENLRIVNGNETGVNEYPWQVLILAMGKPLCGGSLISDQFVLTAGHCTSLSAKVPLASLLIVDLGDHDLTNAKEASNKVYRIEKIIPHAQHAEVHNDISLLKLSKKIEFSKAISPICLPLRHTSEKTYDGKTVYTSGWGKTGDSVLSPVLRKAELQVMPLDTCRELWELVGAGGSEVVEDGMICAGGGNTGPCNGDSGGPLIVKDETEDKYNLIGVTSFGALRGCALEGVPTVFTRVTSFVDWIILNLAQP